MNIYFFHCSLCLFDYYLLVVDDIQTLGGVGYLAPREVVDAFMITLTTPGHVADGDTLDARDILLLGEQEAIGGCTL